MTPKFLTLIAAIYMWDFHRKEIARILDSKCEVRIGGLL